MNDNVNRALKLTVEFTVSNFASNQEIRDMGGLDAAVTDLIINEGLIGCVDDDYKVVDKWLTKETGEEGC